MQFTDIPTCPHIMRSNELLRALYNSYQEADIMLDRADEDAINDAKALRETLNFVVKALDGRIKEVSGKKKA